MTKQKMTKPVESKPYTDEEEVEAALAYFDAEHAKFAKLEHDYTQFKGLMLKALQSIRKNKRIMPGWIKQVWDAEKERRGRG
jgi:hypothetical protein